MRKYKIGTITDKNLILRTDGRYPQRIGSIGTVYEDYFIVGCPMIFQYLERNGKPYSGYLRTSTIEKIEETDHGVWVYTLNSVYRLDTM